MSEQQSNCGEPPVPRVKTRGLLARFDLTIATLLALVGAALAAFFGILLGGLFELFSFVDFLLTRSWQLDPPSLGLGCGAVLVGWLALRIARRLALVILGLVTPKYDEAATDRALVRLDPDEHLLFYDTVTDVCRAVSAPRPDEIAVAAEAECYVLEQREFAFRTSRRLVLVFGLPELLLLSLAELRMIMAHELVHFRHRHTTVVVFLFRFLQSLRQALTPLQRRWWRRADPIYWLFSAFFAVIAWLAEAIERRQELRADAVSASTYGGDLAVRTLLKDWLLANQFESAREDYAQLVASGRMSSQRNLYRFFVDRWRDFSPDAQAYLERRLIEEDQGQTEGGGVPMRTRIQLLRTFPSQPQTESRAAAQLLANVPQLEQQLHDRLVATNS